MNTQTLYGIPRRCSTFADAWSKADAVSGWLTVSEARVLFDAAMKTPADGLIVEVGSYKGRSLTVLAETGRRVIAIDPLEIGMSIAKKKITEKTVAALSSVVARYRNASWIRQRSADCPECVKLMGIDMLHIDACHKYPFPLEDFRAMQDGLHQRAWVTFHDYGREFGVTKSVDELVDEGSLEVITQGGTMIVCRYK